MGVELNDIYRRLDGLFAVVTEVFSDGYYAVETTDNPHFGGPLEEVTAEYFCGLEKVWSWSEASAPQDAIFH